MKKKQQQKNYKICDNNDPLITGGNFGLEHRCADDTILISNNDKPF